MLKTLSRAELDGSMDRDRIYRVLESFDGEGRDDSAFVTSTLELLDVDGVTDAAGFHEWYVELARSRQQVESWPLVGSNRYTSADEALNHVFTFYGESYQLAERIDFEHNPGTAHWGHDLNRFSYLFPLEKAFYETGDRRYGRKAVQLILDWIATTDVADSAPPGRSPYVWRSYLNIAIHTENWSQVLLRLVGRDPELVTPLELMRVAKSVYDQLQYLDWVVPEQSNNWVSIGTRSQLAALACWPCFKAGDMLAARAWERLEKNVLGTVGPDGVQAELTPHYHLCVVRNVRQALLSEPYLNVPAPQKMVGVYKQMLLYLRQTRTPDGRQLAFNDSDPNCGEQIDRILAEPDVMALLGDELDKPPLSQCFPYAGVMIMRQGPGHGTDELYLAFDGGPFGLSHQHEDKLSFWLSAYGRSFIVDPGRHLYDQTIKSYRPYLVTTEAHSTICIDGQGQYSQARRDQWVASVPMPLCWDVRPDGSVTAAASYELGYGEQQIPVTHRRMIEFVPDPGYWTITDEVIGDGAHEVDSYFQFYPGELSVGDGLVHTRYDDANLAVWFEAGAWDSVRVQTGEENPRAGWYSPGVNIVEPAPRLRFTASQRELPATFRYTFMPYRGTTVPTRPA